MFLGQKFKHRKLVVGVGSALVDILAREDDDFLHKTGAIKGGMKYVDKEFIELTMSQVSKKPTMVPGGSACNTVIGIGKLGGSARFVGKRGKGKIGGFFETNLRKNNVDPVLFKSSSFTGRVLSIITGDAQRSMFTFLGASSETQPEEITKKCFENAAIVHIEGYLLFNEDLILAALTAAKEAGAMISLDLASFTVVEESKVLLKKIVKDFVDILLANEDEALAFTGYSDEIKAAAALSEHTHIAALKVGERGSYIAHGGNIVKIEPMSPDTAVDTTGAGDLWASGFLFALVNGYSLEQCANLGSACGHEVCQVIGANIPEQGWQRIKKYWRNHGEK
jgi:sugar/nucleoside kinase (ribokinase family)